MMKIISSRRCDCGFTLIEVLVSLILVVIGVVAIIQLQGFFLGAVSEAEKQAAAYRLAEKKIEELRSYDSRLTFLAEVSSAPPSLQTVNKVDYSIEVDVDNYMADGASLTLLSLASSALTEVKGVTVGVSWSSGSVALSSMIAGIEPNSASLIGLANLGASLPGANHTPGQAPDVISIDVGDDKLKETSRPLPEIENLDRSTVVQFETVTFRGSDNKQLVKEDFLTVNCQCTFSAATTTIRTPYHLDLSIVGGEPAIKWVPGISASGKTGVPKSGVTQSTQFCTRCCAGHHDATDSSVYTTNGVPPFKDSPGHAHYRLNNPAPPQPDVTLSAVNSGDYIEACRFVRVGGMYRLIRDWNMVALNAMPRAILTSSASSSLGTYRDYVGAKVQEMTFAQIGSPGDSAASQGASSAAVLSASLAAASAYQTTSGEQTQFLSRAIYLDDMSYDSDWVTLMSSVAASSAWLSSGDWLEFAPFNEINTTLLSLWKPVTSSKVSVTSNVIDQSIPDGADFYIAYSRGVVEGKSTVGSVAIEAYSKTDNTGILGNTYPDVPAVMNDYNGYDIRISDATSVKYASVVVSNNLCTSACILSGFITLKKPLKTAQFATLNISVSADDGLCSVDDMTDETISALVLTTKQMRYRCVITDPDANGTHTGFVTVTSDATDPPPYIYVIAGGVGQIKDFRIE